MDTGQQIMTFIIATFCGVIISYGFAAYLYHEDRSMRRAISRGMIVFVMFMIVFWTTTVWRN